MPLPRSSSSVRAIPPSADAAPKSELRPASLLNSLSPHITMNTKIRKWLALAMAVLLPASPALAELELGRYTLSHMAAPSLRTTSSLGSVLTVRGPRMAFAMRVGGVAFDAVAAPEGLTVKSLALKYDPNAEDGQRMKLVINGKPVETDIYDWELLPIMNYADSGSTSCFTLFGQLEDEAHASSVLRDGGRILNYDAAFKDTLLGLRLFQLDVLTLGDDFSLDLPKDNGQYLLGAGETEPDLAGARYALQDYNTLIEALSIKETLGGFATNFQSYVITDPPGKLNFSVADGALTFTQEPYYYFWREEYAQREKREQDVQVAVAREQGLLGPRDGYEKLSNLRRDAVAAHDAASDAKRLELARQQGLLKEGQSLEDLDAALDVAFEKYLDAEQEAVFRQGKDLAREGETPATFYRRIMEEADDATGEEKDKLTARNERLVTLADASIAAEKSAYDALEALHAKLDDAVTKAMEEQTAKLDALLTRIDTAYETAMKKMRTTDDDDATGTYLKELSQEHITYVAKLAEMNPAVWNAARKTMRYSAFFRYCKKNHPAAWKQFLQQVRTDLRLAEAQPPVITPTVLQER